VIIDVEGHVDSNVHDAVITLPPVTASLDDELIAQRILQPIHDNSSVPNMKIIPQI